MNPPTGTTVGESRTVRAAIARPGSPIPEYRGAEAEVLGPLAVLPEPPEDAASGSPHGWAVLHVGTGRALGPTLPDRATALKAARLLATEDWAFAHPAYAPAPLAEKVRSVMREVLDQHRGKGEPDANKPARAETLRPGRAA